jgi:tetratricopeptide (TPR) repeat protein
MIKTGVDPETAVERYMQLDINATVNLDRLYEIGLDKQRRRDELTGFKIADIVAEHFRDEAVFRTPYHPNARIAVVLASQFFERLSVSSSDIETMRRAIRITPFPKDELPIHPAVVRHFGLRFVPEERRWRFLNEGTFTIREFYRRYMGCVWNEPLAEGLESARTGELAAARESLETGLAVSPQAAAGYGTLALVFSRLGRREDAIAAARRAIALDPDHAPHRSMLGGLLRTAGEFEAAERELRAAAELDPFDAHFPGHLANFLRERDRLAEALDIVRPGLVGSPYAVNLHVELGHVLVRMGDKAAAEQAFRRAHALDPTNIAPVFGLAEILE